MRTTFLFCLFIAATVIPAGSMFCVASPDETQTTQPQAVSESASVPPRTHVKVLRSDNLQGRHDNRPAKATLIEVTIDPLAASPPHRHPGPVTGYVLEGVLEFQIGDQPLRTLKAGDTFFEPAMILHRVTRNPDKSRPCRILVTMIHPADAAQLAIPEPAASLRAPSCDTDEAVH